MLSTPGQLREKLDVVVLGSLLFQQIIELIVNIRRKVQHDRIKHLVVYCILLAVVEDLDTQILCFNKPSGLDFFYYVVRLLRNNDCYQAKIYDYNTALIVHMEIVR